MSASEGDFVDTPQSRLSLSLSVAQRSRGHHVRVLSSRLTIAISMARATLSQSGQSSVSTELRRWFNNRASSSTGSRRRQVKGCTWKVIPCALPGPSMVKVPTKGSLNELCKQGLGTLWFTVNDKLDVRTVMSPDMGVWSVYAPCLKMSQMSHMSCARLQDLDIPWLCLWISRMRLWPESSRPFSPYFSPDEAKKEIASKKCLLPLQWSNSTILYLGSLLCS